MPRGYHKKTGTPIFKTHGMSNTRFWFTWRGILQRCNDKNASNYNLYGGRGIKCEWNSFEEFYEDMFSSYKNNLSIDRINNNGNYSKENCRWATRREQANNRRSNHYLSFNGKNQSIAEWARELNLTYRLIFKRILRGWSIEKTLTTKRNSKYCNQLTRKLYSI